MTQPLDLLQGIAVNRLASGPRYFWRGVRLLTHPALRLYVLIPLLINSLLFALLSIVLVNYLGQQDLDAWHLPAWLGFLEDMFDWVAWLLLGAIALVVYGYLFNIITNILSAPFYSLLAQRTETLLSAQAPPFRSVTRVIVGSIRRELQKLVYFIIRSVFVLLVMLLLSTLGRAGVLAPLFGIAWVAWSMVVQYADYPAQVHRSDFRRVRKKLRRQRFSSMGFGATVTFFSLLPGINILVAPAAVTGGTLFWLNELQRLPERNKKPG